MTDEKAELRKTLDAQIAKVKRIKAETIQELDDMVVDLEELKKTLAEAD